jgi:tetratricopeptide (TPR) repeat protein
MGNSFATEQLKPAFRKFASYPLSRSRRIIGIFNQTGMAFGAAENDIALLLDGDTSTAKEVVFAFRATTSAMHINILSFISAIIIVAKSDEAYEQDDDASAVSNYWGDDDRTYRADETVAEKIEHILELFDFGGSEQLTKGDLMVALLCIVQGINALLDERRAQSPKATEALSNAMAAEVFQSLAKDDCWSISKAELARYCFRKIQVNGHSDSIHGVLASFGVPDTEASWESLDESATDAELSPEMSPAPPSRPRPSKHITPDTTRGAASPTMRRVVHTYKTAAAEMAVNPFYKQDLAVLIIQCATRVALSRSRLRAKQDERKSASLIQSIQRRRAAAETVSQKRHLGRFAVVIQRIVRRRQAPNVLNRKRSERAAATVVQKHQRRVSAGKHVFDKRESIATEHSNVAYNLYKEDRFDEAAYNYRIALSHRERSRGAEHPATAITLSNLAGIYDQQGRYEEAVALYQRALAIKEANLGVGHPNTATTLNNLALALYNLRDFEQSQALFERCLVIKENASGNAVDVAVTLNNMASCAEKSGNLDDAAGAYRRALAIREVELGPEHPSTAVTINGLASVSLHQGNFSIAEGLYRRLLAIKEKKHGADDPTTARTLNNLALALFNQDDLAGAAGLYERCLDIKIRTNADQQDIASILHNLAGVKNRQKQYKQAHQLYTRALEIREKLFGDNIDTAATCAHLALVLNSLGRVAEALSFMQRALVVKEKVLGPLNASALNSRSWCKYLEARAIDEKRATSR